MTLFEKRVPFDMGFYQCFQLLGAGHVCLKGSTYQNNIVCSTLSSINKNLSQEYSEFLTVMVISEVSKWSF